MHPSQRRSFDINGWLVEHDPLPVSALSEPHGACGFDARSAYVETYWLAILGPSCVLLARRLVSWLEAESGGFEISLSAFAGTLGVGCGVGPSRADRAHTGATRRPRACPRHPHLRRAGDVPGVVRPAAC